MSLAPPGGAGLLRWALLLLAWGPCALRAEVPPELAGTLLQGPHEVKRISALHYQQLRRRALPVFGAQERFHRAYPPWSSQTHFGCPKADGPDANATVSEARRLQSIGAPLRLLRFAKAAGRAFIPQPSVAACLNLEIDLTNLGLPGVILSLGIEGELHYDLCASCFRWTFTALFGFNYCFKVLGAAVCFNFAMRGQVDIQELQCDLAKTSNYCHFLHIILPEYLSRVMDKDRTCHSDSPFEAITSYTTYLWYSLQAWVNQMFFSGQNKDYVGSPLDVNLAHIESSLQMYPSLFLPAPQLPAPPQNFTQASTSKIGVPQQVQSNGKTVYLWVVFEDQRLCWSATKPTVAPQGGDRDFITMAALREACALSIRIPEMTPNSTAVTLKGTTVSVSTIRDRAGPAAFVFATADVARAWWQEFVNLVASLRKGLREILIGQCVGARLDGYLLPSDYYLDPNLYCDLGLPGQGQAFASSYGESTLTPNWQEGAGFRVPLADAVGGPVEVAVTVRNMASSALGRYFEWAQHGIRNLVSGQASDPLAEYAGTARVTVCLGSKPPAVWATISSSRGCQRNGNGIVVEAVGYVDSANNALQACQRMCLSYPGCSAVDFFSRSQRCNIFMAACSDPQTTWGSTPMDTPSSYGLLQLGCDVQQWPGYGPAHVTVPLLRRIDNGDSWNFWMWLRGVEMQQVGTIDLSFQWVPPVVAGTAWKPTAVTGSTEAQPPLPGLTRNAQAMFAALDQFLSKFPEYTDQVERRLRPFDPATATYEDLLLPYEDLDGRFFARWDPNAHGKAAEDEGMVTTTARAPDPETMPCPAPGGAGAMYYMHCALQTWTSSTSSWGTYLALRLQEVINNPPCRGGGPGGRSSDERVVHFGRAFAQSRQARDANLTMDFHAEVATSLLNLFVRVVADVQALWSVYFADDPEWDGDCYSLRPEFHLPYEYGPDYTGGNERLWEARTQDGTLRLWPMRRALELVSQEAPADMSNDENPFCGWAWASGRVGQERRLDFLRQDPPVNGRDGYTTPPRLQSARMFPLVWCEAAQAYRDSRSPGPLQGSPFLNGTSLRYQSACMQVRRIYFDDGSVVSKSWRRYDCEEASLSWPFVTLFPSFIVQVMGTTSARGARLEDVGWFGQLGTIVEDVLQCAGRVAPSMRQFRRRGPPTTDISRLCDGTERHLELLNQRAGQDYADILAFIKTQTQEARSVLRDILVQIGSSATGDLLAGDFRRLFGFTDLQDDSGSMFTGEVWKVAMDSAFAALGTAKKVKARVEVSKDALVLSAWNKLGPADRSASALFPVPIQFRTLQEMSVGISTQVTNLCNSGIPLSLTLAMRALQGGFNFLGVKSQIPSQLCVAGKLAPLPGIQLYLNLQGCWAKNAGTNQYTTTWTFDVRAIIRQSVVSFIDLVADGISTFSDVIAKEALASSRLGWESVDYVNLNIGWQFVRRILLDPDTLLGTISSAQYIFSGNGSAWDFVAGQVANLGAAIQRNVAYLAASIAPWAAYQMRTDTVINNGIKAMKHFWDIEAGELDVLQAGVAFTRTGDTGKWDSSFNVFYLKRGQLGMKLDIPTFVNVDMTVSLTSRHDLSELFNIIFDAHAMPVTYYDCCMTCLQQPGTLYCKAKDATPSCLNASITRACSGSLVANLTQCGSGQDSSGGTTLPGRFQASKVCHSQADQANFAQTLGELAAGEVLGTTPDGREEEPLNTTETTTTTATVTAPPYGTYDRRRRFVVPETETQTATETGTTSSTTTGGRRLRACDSNREGADCDPRSVLLP